MAPYKVVSDRNWKFLRDQLRDSRKAKEWRAEDLATRMSEEPECAGTSAGRVRKLEGGFARPTLSESLALEAIFRIPVRKWFKAVKAGEKVRRTVIKPTADPQIPEG